MTGSINNDSTMIACPQCGVSQESKIKCTYCGFLFEEQTRINRVRLLIKMVLSIGVVIFFAWFVDQKTEFIDNYLFKDKANSKVSEPLVKATKPSSITGVDPTDIYQTYLNQYRLRPDSRFINAFKMLTTLYGRYNGTPDSNNTYRIGEIENLENQVSIPLFKQSKHVKTLTLDLPITFPAQMEAMQDIVEIMGVSNNINGACPQRDTRWLSEQDGAISDFNMLDPRLIINGMLKLEELRKAGGDDSRLFIAAARGYAMLLLGLNPDHMEYKNRFASHALAFLAFAKQIDPEIATATTEAILAMTMGYTAYATDMLHHMPEPENATNRAIEAYMKKDINVLENLNGDGPKLLGHYLLARLYRQMGLEKLSKKKTKKLFQKFPDNYPIVVEAISSLDLNVAKKLTILYPLDILANLEKKVSPEASHDQEIWDNRLETFMGNQSSGDVSFTQFNELLSKWDPFSTNAAHGFFIDRDDVNIIFRALYSGAVYLRFNLLLNRWSVVNKAEKYVTAFRSPDNDHPLVMEMAAEVLKKKGNKKEAEKLFTRVINQPGISGILSTRAHGFLEKYSLARIMNLPVVAASLDGQPASLARMGKLFYKHINFDFAESYYTMSLEHDPYSFYNYFYLAIATGNYMVVDSALKKYSSNIKMLEAAGDYYLTKDDPVSRELAHRCFGETVKLAPSNSIYVKKLADILVKMKRYDEAIEVLKHWLDEFGSTDLDTTITWANIADIYLEMDKPFSAMEILIDNSDTYSLVMFYTNINKRVDAVNVIKRKIKAYSAAHEYLNAGQSDRASEIIAENLYNDIGDLMSNYAKNDDFHHLIRAIIEDPSALAKIMSYIKDEDYLTPVSMIMEQVKIRQLSGNNLDRLIINCIDSGANSAALQTLSMTLNRYQKVMEMLKDQKDKKALSLISKNLDDYQGNIIVHTAKVYEELKQLDLAEKILNKGLQRHFTSGYMVSKAAAFMWRNGRNEEAAELIAKGNKNKDRFSRWFFDDFIDSFKNKPDHLIINATDALSRKGIDTWHISSLAFMLLRKDRPETASKLISEMPTNDMMSNLEKIAHQYTIIRALKGEEAAYEYVSKKVTGDTISIFCMVLFKEGRYELMLELLKNPDSFSRHHEFVWLQKLMAWLAMEKKPTEIAHEFDVHYSKHSSDDYHAIGRFMLEKISQHDLLKMIENPQQRCEFSYYIGFVERMKGNFHKAANWYRICMETLLENNGEFHFASDEMFWWGHMGTKKRHRLLREDMREYYERRNEVYLK